MHLLLLRINNKLKIDNISENSMEHIAIWNWLFKNHNLLKQSRDIRKPRKLQPIVQH